MKVSEYLQEVLKNPEARKDIEELLKTTPPKRKTIVIFDRDIPEAFINSFLNTSWLMKQFKVLGVAANKLSDKDLIKAVQQSGAILVTRDKGFWNNKKFKLKDSPGIIILSGNSSEEITSSFLTTLSVIDFVDGVRRFPDYMHGMKIKASSEQIIIKFIDYRGRLQKEEISL